MTGADLPHADTELGTDCRRRCGSLWFMTAQRPVGPQLRLRTYRRAVVGSAERLVERIAEHGVQVHPDHIRNCELGYQRPSERLLRAWALALGLDPLDVWAPGAADTVEQDAAA